MTHYDKVIDSIVDEIYSVYNAKRWNEKEAKETAHKILQIVEEFQSHRILK